jgi:hypothetical protein
MKYIKWIIGVLVVLAIAFLVFKCLEKERKLTEYEQADKKVSKQIQKEAIEIKRQVDKKGIESVLFDITGHKATLDQLVSNDATKGIDTTAMALDIRTNQLKQILVIKATLEANNLQLKKQLDSSRRLFYTYNGNGLKLRFTPPDILDSNSKATADFTANVGIKATQYWKRSWFLGAKKSILAVTTDMPKMFKINGADYIEFEQKQPSFGFRVQASTNYNPQTGSVGFGPAARFDVGRVSFQGNYTWYPESQRWRPSINANYDLVRF